MIRWKLRHRVLPIVGALLSAAVLLALYVAVLIALSILLGPVGVIDP